MCASSSKLSHSAARFEELKASVSDCDYELIDIVLLSCTLAESWKPKKIPTMTPPPAVVLPIAPWTPFPFLGEIYENVED
ncbi:hypothetical protein HPB47_016062 [Ixodes persulcatus]|uniref:Uncharacterized protein n=1 Tax=Ixodes persulcatus TaxID=34615 RepID=A0AC60R3D3_IXOPE|nr:hypothetical protein HPB47_016062 [Ixodes persulcatus]